MENWKDIKGYEGYYQVSDLGNVRSLDREIDSSWGKKNKLKGKILKKIMTPNGYERVNLSKDGKRNKSSVHRLVAETFIDNPENKPYVNHKDSNKTNNSFKNLEWCTPKENTSHCIENGGFKASHKIRFYNDEEELLFKSKSEACRYFGHDNTYVSHMIKDGKKEIKGYKYELL